MAMQLNSTMGEANALCGKDERSSREMCALLHTGQVRLPKAKSIKLTVRWPCAWIEVDVLHRLLVRLPTHIVFSITALQAEVPSSSRTRP